MACAHRAAARGSARGACVRASTDVVAEVSGEECQSKGANMAGYQRLRRRVTRPCHQPSPLCVHSFELQGTDPRALAQVGPPPGAPAHVRSHVPVVFFTARGIPGAEGGEELLHTLESVLTTCMRSVNFVGARPASGRWRRSRTPASLLPAYMCVCLVQCACICSFSWCLLATVPH